MSILSPEEREQVAEELERFAKSLNLSDDQKQRLQSFLTDAREKVREYKEAHPNASAQDLLKQVKANRTALRERLVKFLSPEQLTKWDAAWLGNDIPVEIHPGPNGPEATPDRPHVNRNNPDTVTWHSGHYPTWRVDFGSDSPCSNGSVFAQDYATCTVDTNARPGYHKYTLTAGGQSNDPGVIVDA